MTTNSVSKGKLGSDADWDGLWSDLDQTKSNLAVKNILGYLRSHGAQSVVIENEYLDQDFSVAYSSFYSQLFKKHTKVCRRFSFFSQDVTPLFDKSDPADLVAGLEKCSADGQYLGFVVIRPVKHAPLARSVLRDPDSPDQMSSHLLVRADYIEHLLGAKLLVSGAPYTQQDTRVGACAQAAIWTVSRHIHTRHRGPWKSTVDITRAATNITDNWISRSLPAGSEFLTDDNMVRAIRAMERRPLMYTPDILPPNPANPNVPVVAWKTQKPEDIINRYVDSGIPVIACLENVGSGSVGHAVVVVGHVLHELPSGQTPSPRSTRAIFCECFLVVDDQRGVNLRMPVRAASTIGETGYSVEANVRSLIVPLPDKVFIAAEHAEKLAWDLCSYYQRHWHSFRTTWVGDLASSVDQGDIFVDAMSQNKVIARTYLTYGWKYKARLLHNCVHKEVKDAILYKDLPRFVWVTEFGTLDSLNHMDFSKRRISAHAVVDATSSHFQDAILLFHAPGAVRVWEHDSDNTFGDYRRDLMVLKDEAEYYPKLRGYDDFSAYAV